MDRQIARYMERQLDSIDRWLDRQFLANQEEWRLEQNRGKIDRWIHRQIGR